MIRSIIEVLLWIIALVLAVFAAFLGVCKAISCWYDRKFQRSCTPKQKVTDTTHQV